MSNVSVLAEQYTKLSNRADIPGLRALMDELRSAEGGREQALYHLSEGTVSFLSGHFENVLASLEQAWSIAGEHRDVRIQITISTRMMELHMRMGNLELALESGSRSLEMAELLDDQEFIGGALSNIGAVYSQVPDPTRSLEYYFRALDVHIQTANQRFKANTLYNIGLSYLNLNEYALAEEYLNSAIATLRELGDEWYAINAEAALGYAYLDQDRVDEGLAAITRALHEAEARDLAEAVSYLVPSLANQQATNGHMEEAIQLVRQYENKIVDNPLNHAMMLLVQARIKKAEGDLEGAAGHLRNADELLVRHASGQLRPEIQQQLAEIAKLQQDLDRYIQHNDIYHKLKEESRGTSVMRQVAMHEKEREIQQERQARERERAVLYSALPRHVADRVIRGETVEDHFAHAAILFADIAGFTTHTSSMHPSDTIKLLEHLYKTFDAICAEHGVVKVKTIGDSYLCFAHTETGDRRAENDPETRIAAVALAMQNAEFYWPTATANSSSNRIQLRIGVHSGPVSAGVIGSERLQYDIWGDTVNTASRMESTGEAGRIQVSSPFATALGNGESGMGNAAEVRVIPSASEEPHSPLPITYSLRERGAVEVKGKGTMTTYWLE